VTEDAVDTWRNRVSDLTNVLVRGAGSVTAMAMAVLVIVAFLVWGAVRGFSHHWFFVLHGVTGVVAFLMVFLIRHAEGRASRATLLKLDELIAATSGASDELVGVEQGDLDDQEELEEEAPARQPGPDDPERAEERSEGTIPTVDRLSDVTRLVEMHPNLYIRHSKGPEADAEDGASRDYEADVDLPGLSVSTIAPEEWWPGAAEDGVARRICKYDDLTEEDPSRFPWLLTGKQVGWGPDHEPLVRLDRPIALISRSALAEARQRYETAFDVGEDSTN
jgi:low affinity Fe/Cu permease